MTRELNVWHKKTGYEVTNYTSIHAVAMYAKMYIRCNIPISEKLPSGHGLNGYHKFYYTSVVRSMIIASFILNFNTTWR
jgi:hypothetical protein